MWKVKVDKPWSKCSKAERKEFKEIQDAYKVITWQVNNLWIPRVMYQRGCEVLLEKLERLGNKYDEVYRLH